MKKTYYEKTLKIGKHGNGKRICLWHKSMIEAGFDFGTKISIKYQNRGPAFNRGLHIVPDVDGKRKVNSVMNHGTRLPVIDLKGKMVDSVFDGATHVKVKIVTGIIKIQLDGGFGR